MKDINCPYCGFEQEIDHDNKYEQDQQHQTECMECGKTFVFETEISFSYTASKADCLNGAEHQWKETNAIPRCFRRLQCPDCGEEKEIEGTEVERKAYFAEMEKERAALLIQREHEQIAGAKEHKRIMKIVKDANKAKGI